jgi:hypothetical protein
MTLTITGKTNDEGLKLYVGQEPTDNTVYNSYTDLVFGEEEAFSVSFDLKTMPIGGWYNVRLYFTDGNYHTISLNDAKNGSGEALALWSWVILENTQVQICSWNEGEIPTLSFKVEEYVKPSYEATVTGGSIEEKDGKIILTVNGTTNDNSLILLVGVSDDPSVYGHAVTVTEGQFTSTVDLSTLAAGGGWYNVRIIMSDGNMVSVPYDKLGVALNDTFYSSDKKVTIKNWSTGDKLTSLLVENYNSDADSYDYFLQGGQVSMSNMPFSLTAEGETAYLKFDGLFGASNKVERTIELILTTEDPSDTPASLDASKIVYTAANKYEGDSNQAFSFKIDVKEIGKQSGWMRFVLKVTEGDKVAYYTIKPSVPAHTGDWNAIGSPVTIDGIKYELAICWSSVFIQTP